MTAMKQESVTMRDLIDPGWRERDADRCKAFADAIPVRKSLGAIRQQTTPCGECHIQPGDRCDICGAVGAA